MRRRALGLAEILVVLTIVALLAALLYPVLTSAKSRAKETACVSNLRQLAICVAIYRTDWQGDGITGDMYSMGLPPQPFTRTMASTRPLWRCDGPAKPPKLGPNGLPYVYVPTPPGMGLSDTTWANYASRKGERAVVFVDLNHNPATTSLLSPYTTKFGIAVRLDTSIVQRRRIGDPWNQALAWWD